MITLENWLSICPPTLSLICTGKTGMRRYEFISSLFPLVISDTGDTQIYLKTFKNERQHETVVMLSGFLA